MKLTYQDLIKENQSRLEYMEKDYRRRVIEGSMTVSSADRKIELQKRLVRLLKKYSPERQIDLFKEFG